VIQYDETIEEYNQALLNTLRGFSPQHDFISTWVPDADLTVSIISLIESAFSESVFQFTIVFSSQLFDEYDENRFREGLGLVADFEVLSLSNDRHYVVAGMKAKNTRTSFQRNQRLMQNANGNQAVTETVSQINNDDIYAEKINEFAVNRQNHGRINKVIKSGKVLSVSYNNIALEVIVDEELIVHKIAYQGDLVETQLGIFEAASQLLVGLPLTEIRDNGLALIEYKLRASDKHRRMSGIQCHFNFSTIFDELKAILQLLCREYAPKKLNTFDIRNQLKLSQLEKDNLQEKITQTIADYLTKILLEQPFNVESIDDKARVTVMFGGDLNMTIKSQLLMDLEVILRKDVHAAIQLYSTLYVDRNTKRQGHQWAINL